MDELENQPPQETPPTPAAASLEHIQQMLAKQSEQLEALARHVQSFGAPVGEFWPPKTQAVRLPRQAGLSEQLQQSARQAAASGKRADVLAFLKIRRVAQGR